MIKSLKDNSGVVLVVILAIMPIIVWLLMAPLAGRFSSYFALFRSLGQLSGLLGMALLSINFILSTRLRYLDKLFSGLNKVYVKHHLIGAFAFCFLLFHPTFLTIQYLFISLGSSFNFIFSIQDWPTNFGKLGLLVLIVLMVITFYINFRYQKWKSTHKYLGVVLFLGGFHMLLVPSDISNNAFLKYYMLALASLAAVSYLYRTVFKIYKRGEYKYVLKEVANVNDKVVEIKMSPLSERMKFMPGQFVFLRFESGGVMSESHPFSITSSGGDGGLSLGIKALGSYTEKVHLLKPGTICYVEGPFGAFSYKNVSSKRQIWIAAGIGITPFLGMARHMSADKGGAGSYDIDLYYSVRNEGEAAFAQELSKISKENSNFRLKQHFSDRDGYISADMVAKSGGNISDAEIFLCGPPGFMKNLRDQFVKLNFNNNRIHSEEFSL